MECITIPWTGGAWQACKQHFFMVYDLVPVSVPALTPLNDGLLPRSIRQVVFLPSCFWSECF